MTTLVSQEIITHSIEYLLNTYLPSTTFKYELHTFLSYCKHCLAQEDEPLKNPEPLAKFLHETFREQIDATIARQEHTVHDLATARATRASLRALRALPTDITKASLVAALGGMDVYRSYMDREIFAQIAELGEKARWKKAVLQHRIWVAHAMVEEEEGYGDFLGAAGDLMVRLLICEGQWQCDCWNLFTVEQQNREMVVGWLRG